MTHQETTTRLVNALSSRRISVPLVPTGSMGEYLLRGDPDLSKWSINSNFIPRSGQWATWGVFLGDNLSCLMYPNPGIYWVFKPETLAQNWLNLKTPEFNQLVQEITRQRNLNPALIADGYCCERQIYETRPTYDPSTGIASVEHPVPTSLAVAAIMVLADSIEIK